MCVTAEAVRRSLQCRCLTRCLCGDTTAISGKRGSGDGVTGSMLGAVQPGLPDWKGPRNKSVC
eukprot:650622-Prymnesium_polylepis.1